MVCIADCAIIFYISCSSKSRSKNKKADTINNGKFLILSCCNYISSLFYDNARNTCHRLAAEILFRKSHWMVFLFYPWWDSGSKLEHV